MINVWPSGCVCHAVRAPGSNVTLPPPTRAGSGAWNSGSMRTTPEKYSVDPARDGCEPFRLISIIPFLRCIATLAVSAAAGPAAASAALPVTVSMRLRVNMAHPVSLPASSFEITRRLPHEGSRRVWQPVE